VNVRALLAVPILFCLLGATGQARAQELVAPAPRQGYYLGGGLRSGVLTMHSDNVGSLGLMQGGAFVVRAGEMAGNLFGFGITIAAGGGGNKEWGGGYGGLLMDFQLVPEENLAVRAGIGLAGFGVGRADENQKKENDPKGGLGTIYTAGFSYDWFPFWEKGDGSGGLAFSPFFEGQLIPVSGVIAGGVFLGVEVTYWFGLSANRLRD
jgi:hypothetical protein